MAEKKKLPKGSITYFAVVIGVMVLAFIFFTDFFMTGNMTGKMFGKGKRLQAKEVSKQEQSLNLLVEGCEVMGALWERGFDGAVCRIKDFDKNVTCWVSQGGGISCIPDKQLKE